MTDEKIPAPKPSPYPSEADPNQLAPIGASEGEEVEVSEVEFGDPPSGARGIAPFVVAVAAGVTATLVVNGGSWIIKEAWQSGTREPVPTPRPPILFDKNSGFTYIRQDNGAYARSGTASQI